MDEIQYLFSPYTERNILFNTGVARNSRLAQRIQKKPGIPYEEEHGVYCKSDDGKRDKK